MMMMMMMMMMVMMMMGLLDGQGDAVNVSLDSGHRSKLELCERN